MDAEGLEEVLGDLLDAVVLQNIDDTHVDDKSLAVLICSRNSTTWPAENHNPLTSA